MAHCLNAKIVCFGYLHNTNEVFLLTEPAGPSTAEHAIVVLWTGVHYDLLIMSPEAWNLAQKPAIC